MENLNGTVKQVAWATDIRASYFSELAKVVAKNATVLANYREMGETVKVAELERCDAMYTRTVATLEAITDARFWIEHRPFSTRGLVVEIARQTPEADGFELMESGFGGFIPRNRVA